MKCYHFIFCSALLFVASSCQTIVLRDQLSSSEIQVAYQESQREIEEERQTQANLSLSDKALFFEKRLERANSSGILLYPKFFIDGKFVAERRIDFTALYLASVAAKYRSSPDLRTRAHLLEVFKALQSADELNGRDGFLPYKVNVNRDAIKISSNETHINVYTQLIFAYQLIWDSNDRELKELCRAEFRLIFDQLSHREFILCDHLGEEVPYSDIAPSFWAWNRSRKLSLLSILEFSKEVFANSPLDKERFDLAKKTLQKAEGLAYQEDILDMHLSFFNMEFPTHSSSWLNFISLYIAYEASGKNVYKEACQNLYAHYADENNALFDLIYMSCNTREQIEKNFKSVRQVLEGFPLDLRQRRRINSLQPELGIIKGNYVKFERVEEVEQPLAIMARPLNSYEWKRNQMRVDGYAQSLLKKSYTGIDYLNAYYLLRILELEAED